MNEFVDRLKIASKTWPEQLHGNEYLQLTVEEAKALVSYIEFLEKKLSTLMPKSKKYETSGACE